MNIIYSSLLDTTCGSAGQTDTRSRSRQYIDRAKDWVEWTLEKHRVVKNSVLPLRGSNKVGKIFNGNLLQRLLEYEYFANYKQKQYKIYIISNTGNFTTFSQSFNFKSSF